MAMKILFVSWDGPQVTYLEGHFLPIFEKLGSAGLKFHVLHFVWGNPLVLARTRSSFARAGIPYRPVLVWRWPIRFGSLLTTLVGGKLICKMIRLWGIEVVMPRSNLPALATLYALRRLSLPVIFDADGLPLDERVEFKGLSASGFAYRFLRDIEAEMVRRADRVLTRSRAASEILLARAGAGTVGTKFHVVCNGRDADKFCRGTEALRRATRQELGIDSLAPVIVYVGSLGGQYCFDEMLDLFETLKQCRTNARLLILSGSPELARAALAARPTLEIAAIVKSVPPYAVPRYLACADLGLALRRPSFSMQGVAPIKVGEYLLCGLPVVATRGVGDTSAIDKDVGFLSERMDQDEFQSVVSWFCDRVLCDREGFATRCRKVGTEFFSLKSCTDAYLAAFRALGHDL
jgi:glycosyltransferase involved in cell wall biosynthesis